MIKFLKYLFRPKELEFGYDYDELVQKIQEQIVPDTISKMRLSDEDFLVMPIALDSNKSRQNQVEKMKEYERYLKNKLDTNNIILLPHVDGTKFYYPFILQKK